MISSTLINILMFYVRMQIKTDLMCSIDLEIFLILKKWMIYIIPSFWQILIIDQLSDIHFRYKASMVKTLERASQVLLTDTKSSYSSLLEKSRKTTILHLKCIKRIACEVYKSLNKLIPAFMTDMFQERNIFLWFDSTYFKNKIWIIQF